jgi:uncharacterized lipoprotein YddW (UPF0748 family)
MTLISRRRVHRLLALLAVAGLVGCVAFTAPSTPTPPTASASPSTPPSAPPATADGAVGAAGPAATGTPPPPAALPPGVDPAELPPPVPREFRAAWVATVANIDWPSKPGLAAEAQRAEALALLDRAQSLGLNALILQVRPAGDALYPSALEPWSEYLTGEQGKPPQPLYDPLAFWVQEAHRRALELHVWFNPYRARHSSAKTPQVAPHLAVRQPALVKRYGEQQWMDPGEPAAAAHTLAVVADVVRRYDIDGVHIDDYFYPYPVSVPAQGGVEVPFPDEESYARYRLGGGQQLRDDWRRANVDSLVQQLYTTVHQIKPWVRVGISPFGLGRPDRRPPGVGGPAPSTGSASPVGFSQYDKLYADVERWFTEGWLDYLAPQLYWQINREGLQFPVLLDLWVAENTKRRHLWPGLFTSQVTKGEALGPRAWPAREIAEQIALQRQRGERANGHIHFSMVALMQNRDGLATLLQGGAYAQPALVPATPWLDEQAPPAPTLRRQGARVAIEPAAGEAAARWAVWRRVGGSWRFAVLPGAERGLDPAGADRVAVSAVDRVGNTSAQHVLVLP